MTKLCSRNPYGGQNMVSRAQFGMVSVPAQHRGAAGRPVAGRSPRSPGARSRSRASPGLLRHRVGQNQTQTKTFLDRRDLNCKLICQIPEDIGVALSMLRSFPQRCASAVVIRRIQRMNTYSYGYLQCLSPMFATIL